MLMEQTYYLLEDSIVVKTYDYEFDSIGNFIKRIEYGNNDEPLFIVEREIKYYE